MPKPDSDRYKVFFEGLKEDSQPTEEPAIEPALDEPKRSRAKFKGRTKKPPTARSTDSPKIPRINRSPLAKSKNPNFEKATYYLPKTTTRKMRLHAVDCEIEMSDLVNVAVIEYLKNNKPDDA